MPTIALSTPFLNIPDSRGADHSRWVTPPRGEFLCDKVPPPGGEFPPEKVYNESSTFVLLISQVVQRTSNVRKILTSSLRAALSAILEVDAAVIFIDYQNALVAWPYVNTGWNESEGFVNNPTVPSSKSTFSQPFREKCIIREVVRIGSRIICLLSKQWKAKFFILYDVISLARLQGKFEVGQLSE